MLGDRGYRRPARIVLATLLVAGICGSAAAQSASDLDAALQQLHDGIREAAARHDRAALERLYADEYVFIHTTGGAELKQDYITRTLTAQPPQGAPAPAQQQVYQQAYGDVVVRTVRVAAPNNPIWWTYVYVKRDGRWQIARQHGTAAPAERPTAVVTSESLAKYAGGYQYQNGASLSIRVDGTTLIAQGSGRPEVTLIPEGDSRFHLKDGNALYTFVLDDTGTVTGVVLRRPTGEEVRATKLPK